jgi:hypothetical protein
MKTFKVDFHSPDLIRSDFSQEFQLENGTLLDILNRRSEIVGYSMKYGLSKRCDIFADIYSDHGIIASLKNYFYLNQCKVNVINENPEKVYCTEDKEGNHNPIMVKIVFGNCVNDNISMYPIDYINTDMSPRPGKKIGEDIGDEDDVYTREP